MKKATVELPVLIEIERILASRKQNTADEIDALMALNKIIQDAENPCLDMADLLAKMSGPIAFFDTETTGTKPAEDRIVSLDVAVLYPDGEIVSRRWLVNPGIPIPEAASNVHGIWDEQVADAPSFSEIAEEVENFIRGCDLAHFNGDHFDIPLLAEEMDRAGLQFSMIGRISLDCSNIFRKKEPRTLSAALEFYVGEDHEGAHDSKADVEATLKVFLAQLKRYPDLCALSLAELANETCFNPNKVDLAGKLILNDEGEILYNFGQHIGKKVADHTSYAAWMLGANFPADTKRHLERILEQAGIYQR